MLLVKDTFQLYKEHGIKNSRTRNQSWVESSHLLSVISVLKMTAMWWAGWCLHCGLLADQRN